jgi:hypothetical protein
MRSFVILSGLICLFALSVFAQTSGVPSQSPIKKDDPFRSTDKFAVKSISEEDWKLMEDALLEDNWTKSARLAKDYLGKLKTETTDKQIARLRYIYLYSMAGKVLGYSFAEKKAEEEKAREDLKKAVSELIGERFMFPTRRILANCGDALNYICASDDKPGFLYVIAANSNGTVASPSIEYIDLGSNNKFDIKKHDKKAAVLSGILKRAEFNLEKTDEWVMRLFFEDGFVAYLYEDLAKDKE